MYKAKVVNRPDKVAAPQYNEANLDTWQPVEHEWLSCEGGYGANEEGTM